MYTHMVTLVLDEKYIYIPHIPYVPISYIQVHTLKKLSPKIHIVDTYICQKVGFGACCGLVLHENLNLDQLK
jgi:hypothetical protein